MRPSHEQRGLTLVELLVTLTLASIVLTLGVSGFQAMVANNRMAGAANGLIAHLQYARSEAVNRAGRVTVCPSSDGATCLSADPSVWNQGYLVATLDASSDPDEILMIVPDDDLRGLDVDSGGRERFIFQHDGSGTAGTLRLCDPSDSSRIRLVVVSAVGRSYVTCNNPSAYTCPRTCP